MSKLSRVAVYFSVGWFLVVSLGSLSVFSLFVFYKNVRLVHINKRNPLITLLLFCSILLFTVSSVISIGTYFVGKQFGKAPLYYIILDYVMYGISTKLIMFTGQVYII